MAETVYSYEKKGLFKLRITGHNAGRYSAYCKRIGVEEGSEASKVDETTPDGVNRVMPSFFETRYFVRCDFEDSAVRDVFVNHKMASVTEAFDFDGKTLVGTLDFVNAPGKFRFEIVWSRGTQRESVVFDWMVVSEKLDVQHDYAKIVETVEASAPGLVRAFLAKSKGQAGLVRRSDTNDAIWADIFNEVSDRYQKACEWVTNRPHLKYVAEVEYRRAGRIKRWTTGLVNRYAMMDDGRRQVAVFRTEQVSPQVDTVENRFVKFTLKAIADRLEKFVSVCKGHEKTVSPNFAGDLAKRVQVLRKIAHKPFFSGVGRFTGFRQESMAMQRKQGYADIYATWTMLQKTLDTTLSGFLTGHRPISALYEFWCFLRIADILEKDFGYPQPEGRIEGAHVYDDLFEEPDPDKINMAATLSALSYTYVEKDGTKLRLLYQQSYGNESAAGDLAYYNPQRPDIVLVVERSGETYTYLFDAKYRIDVRDQGSEKGLDASPAEPINDMHRYRDAILYREQKGDKKLSRQIVGAYVLYPGRPRPKSYNYADLITHENIGAIPLLPGESGGAALKSFIGDILGKKTPEAHLAADIPTRGTSVMVGEMPDEKSLVNVHWDEEKAEDIFAYACYRKAVPVEKELLSGMDPAEVRSLRISVGGRVVAVVTGVTQFTGIGLEKSPNELGDSGWETRLNPVKRYYLFEAKSLPAAPDWVSDFC